MKRITIILLCFVSILLLNINRINAQKVQSKQLHTPLGWSTNNPFKTDVFVENKGQFNNWVQTSQPILYAVNNSDKVFFTKQGLIFKLIKMDTISEEEEESLAKIKDNDKEKDKEEKIFYVTMTWEDCNPDAKIIASEPNEGYYTFGEKGYENVKAKGYHKLLYKNLYPFIDVEYTIPDKGGIKYKLILHPGANSSLIKMKYSGDVEELKIDNNSNIIIETPIGVITDHAPESYYEFNKASINSSFKINKNTVSFQLPTSNSTLQTIIIDPWTTSPTSLSSNNVALDIAYDKYGNVYFSGGTCPYKLSKYSNAGVFLWTFTNPTVWANYGSQYCYSKFCILVNTGTTFIGEGFTSSYNGCRIMKISNNGILTYTSSYFGANNEIWQMFYNDCNKKLIAFGGGTNSVHNIKLIADTSLSSCTSKNFNGASCSGFNDIVCAVQDNNGDFYALTSSYSACSSVEGHLQKSPYSTSYSPPCIFDIQTSYQFQEGYGGLQGITGGIETVRANSLALNSNYIFGFDGKTLKAWNKTNGTLLSTTIVDNTYASGSSRLHEGIDVDECNNIYVGGTNKVHVFSFNGTAFTTLTPITTNISGEVRDIKLNRSNGKLYVCGNGFVSEVIAPIVCNLSTFITTVTISTDTCFGSACVTVSGGIPPYNYQWSNGSTSNCISGVPTGIFTVTVTDNSCTQNTHTDTVSIISTIIVTLNPPFPKICLHDSIALIVSSTSSGVTYHWSNGHIGNTIKVSPSVNSSYSVIGSSSTCSDTVSVMVVVNPIKQTTINPVFCQGGSIHIGTHTYTSTGIYKDTLTTYLGCDSIVTTNLTVNPVKQTTLNPSICQGQTFHLGIHNYSLAGTYKDTLATYLGCDSIITTHLTVNPKKSTQLNPVICQGDSYHVGSHIYTLAGIYKDTLTTYLGCDSLITTYLLVNPNKQTTINPIICQGHTYCVGTHLYTNTGNYIDTLFTNLGCDSIITTHLTVNPKQLTNINPTICQGDSIKTGIHTYKLTGTYSDTLATYLGCDSIITTHLIVKQQTQTNIKPVICVTESFQVGIHTYNIQGNYTDTLKTNIGCDSIVFTNLKIVPKPIIDLGNDTILCFGKTLLLNATYQYSSYIWHDHSTKPTYTASLQGTYYVKVIIDSNCFASDSIKITYQDCETPEIYIPNAFTPDGDGKNDVFKIKTINEFSKFKLYIYDRWGELIFESTDKDYGWDGTYMLKPVPLGVYVYLLTATIKDTNEQIKKTGNVTVVR